MHSVSVPHLLARSRSRSRWHVLGRELGHAVCEARLE